MAGVILTIATVLVLPGCSQSTTKIPPQASGGVLDLAGWDFQKDGPIELKGEWKFKWMASSPEFAKPDFDDSGWETFRVPDFWNRAEHTAEGYAWFRLNIIHLSPPGGALGLSVKTMCTSGRLFIDGREVMHNGIPGTTRETTTACVMPQTAAIQSGPGGAVTVVWNIANFHNRNGGPRFSPVVGIWRDISSSQWLVDLRDIFVSGAIIMMGLYNIILWLMRRADKTSLVFAGLCLFLALRVVIMSCFAERMFPDADMFDPRMRLESLVTLLAAVCYVNFFARLFPLELHKTLVRVSSGILLILSLAVLIFPCWESTHFTLPGDLFFGLNFLWLVVSMVQAVRKGRDSAKISLFGLLLFGVTVANDVIYTSTPSLHSMNLFGMGTIGVIICYSAILSYRFARAHKLSETLSRDLRREVDRQTEKISDQNRELEKLVRERTDSFVNFNHEIKTPLTLIGTYLEQALASHSGDHNLAIVRQNLDKLKRDVTNSLDLEKLIRNQVFYDHSQAVCFTRVLREKIRLFGVLARNKGLTLDFSEHRDVSVRIDPFALDRIINNLLDNAIRYTPAGGRITVTLSGHTTAGRRVELCVADTGVGIPPSQLEHIFEPYYQVRHKKSNRQGMGMGLNIVKRILNELGGEIKVESREREGSRFTLNFPAGAPPAAADAVQASPVVSQPLPPAEVRLRPETFSEHKDTLLIVEDNTDMLAFLQESLAEEYNVYYARSGREAVLKLETIPPPELILSDIMMDEMDGYELLDLLVRSEDYRSIPLVFLTARSLPGDTLAGLCKGAVDVIQKPFSLPALKAKIGSLVRQRKAAREAIIGEMKEKMDRLPVNGYGRKELDLLREENYRRFRMTPREREIIPLLVQGFIYKEISDRLSISLNTLKPYISDIYKKCGVNNKVGLISIFKTD